jgi:malonyl CoA-acyl carrier protein transacylase/phosphopantetheinyl transferase
MLRELALASPLVRGWFDWLDGVFEGEREIAHRLVLYPSVLGPTESERKGLEELIRRVDYGSEAVFTADMALFSLLRALGVRPDYMVGHSTGENAALFASGLVKVTPDSLAEIVRRMNGVFAGVHASGHVPTGTLITVGAIARDVVDAVLADHPEIHLTMDNCPNQVILFGPAPLMERVRSELTEKGALCTDLPMSWAYHTPFVAPMADAFAEILHEGLLAKPSARVYSCATAQPFPEDAKGIRAFMHAQYVSRVRFTETVQRLYQDGARVFIEVGPGGVLTGFVGDILRDQAHLALAADSRRAPGLEHLCSVLGQLFVNQVPVDLAPLQALRRTGNPVRAKAPTLESALPFIQLDDAEITRVRTMLAPASSVAPPTAPQALPVENDFVTGEIAVGVEGGSASYAGVSSWRGHVALPFAATIEMVSLDEPAEVAFDAGWFEQHLAPADIAYFATDIATLGPKRQRDWLVGRIAARRAVSIWLADRGLYEYEPELVYDTMGRPMVADETVLSVYLSVSHKDGIGVAVASDRRVGIDLERLTSVHDPRLLAQTAFTLEEQALLRNVGWDRSELIAIAWSAKEAVAKSLGRKLLGQETSLAITHIDTQAMTLSLAHGQGEAEAFYSLDGDYVCVVAAASDRSRAEGNWQRHSVWTSGADG